MELSLLPPSGAGPRSLTALDPVFGLASDSDPAKPARSGGRDPAHESMTSESSIDEET
jgi:hypothetical protein